MKTRVVGAALVLALLVAGRITINIYFPVPEVRRAAEQIVEEAWGGSAVARPSATNSSDSSWLSPFLPLAVGSPGTNSR